MGHSRFQNAMEARRLLLSGMKLQVVFLLSLRFGSSFVESTTSSTAVHTETQPTAMKASMDTSNISGIEISTTYATLNTASVPNPTSSTPAPNPSPQVMTSIDQVIDEELRALVQELKEKITKEMDPSNPNPSDINVIKILTKIIDRGMAFLRKYNDSGNSTVDIFNFTESLVVTINKYDCLRNRKALLPDRSRDFIAEALKKFTDDVELTLQCPEIIKNDTRAIAESSRKRREVEIVVTVDLAKANLKEDDNFHEFQMLYHHTRYRRDTVTQDCGQPTCDFKRFETNLTMTNRKFEYSLKDNTSSDYMVLTKQLQDTLRSAVGSQTSLQDVNTFKYYRANADNVKATFYLDVKRPEISEETVIKALKDALANGRLGDFEVNNESIFSLHRIVVHGNYSDWTPWGACDNSYRESRTRECSNPRPQYGGRCNGPSIEKRQCACSYTLNNGGDITSPRFPDDYPNDIHCKWLLEAPVDNTVVLKLEEFHLEEDKKCFYDYVEFYEGNTTNADSRISQRLCGQKTPMEIKSVGRRLLVVFQTDKTLNNTGFRFSWKASKIVSKPIEYVEQYVTTLAMIYSPVVNYTHLPLGTATTCPSTSSDLECIFDATVYIISRLITILLDRTLPLAGKNRIVVNFEHIMNEKLFPKIYTGQKYCVTWNNQVGLPSSGGWTRRGCSVVRSNLTHTSCACDHHGLLAVVGHEKVSKPKFKLLANTYIGLGISFLILILAIVHIVWKIEVHGGEVMRINICAAILAMQCVFLIGAHVKAQQTLCSFLTFAIYFSVLAEFCWLLLHGLRIHGKIKKIFASNLNIEIVYVVIGWGLPLLLALIAIGVKFHTKNADDVCWTAATGSAVWGYAAPVVVIALINVAVLLKLLIPTEDVRNHYDYEEMRFRVIKDAICLAFFGLTCTFAYQTFDNESFLEQYLFSAFVVMQALVMFVFGREGRKDFVKREEERRQETEESLNQEKFQTTELDLHIYESIQEPKVETDLGDGHHNRARYRKTSNHPPDKIMAPTLKNLNIYKEGGHYIIEA